MIKVGPKPSPVKAGEARGVAPARNRAERGDSNRTKPASAGATQPARFPRPAGELAGAAQPFGWMRVKATKVAHYFDRATRSLCGPFELARARGAWTVHEHLGRVALCVDCCRALEAPRPSS